MAAGDVTPAPPSCTAKMTTLMFLTAYAVSLGNVWRFPYMVYANGGGAFLIPYFLALIFLALPLYILELGFGQMFQEGTMGIWYKMGLARQRGVAGAATLFTCMANIYYNVVLAWALYYLGRTLYALATGGPGSPLPWSDRVPGFACPEATYFPKMSVAGQLDLVDPHTGLFNPAYRVDFWCPLRGLPTPASVVPSEYSMLTVRPEHCPALAAVQFWEREVLMQSSGLDSVGSVNGGLIVALAASWVLVYLCSFKAKAQILGGAPFVVALWPLLLLFAFFLRAVSLPNAHAGTSFFLSTDASRLADPNVWIQAVGQNFYSLSIGFGTLTAFSSVSQKESDYAGDATRVVIVNTLTAMGVGLATFPVLGFLASEMATINPCMDPNHIGDLSAATGLSGPGLIFVAFPIAMTQMTGGYVWAVLFFLMLVCISVDLQATNCENIAWVLQDSGICQNCPKGIYAGVICFLSFLASLIFCTGLGVYLMELLDHYGVVSLLFVTAMEVLALMWLSKKVWPIFKQRTREWTGHELSNKLFVSWRYICPTLLLALAATCVAKYDLMDARHSWPHPLGQGRLPFWSVRLGWAVGVLPILVYFVTWLLPEGEARAKDDEDASEKLSVEELAAAYGSFNF